MNSTYCNTTNSTISNLTSCVNSYGHSLSRVFSIGISIYFICLITGGVFCNTILIHTIIWRRSLYNAGNVFIVNLSICDLITATSTIPFDTDFILRGYYNYGTFICGLKETVFMFSLPSSMVNLLLLTVERFIKIIYPYRYPNIFIKKNVILVLLLSWSYYGIVALFPLMYDSNASHVADGKCFVSVPLHYVSYQLTVNFFIPLCCIITMNMMIFRTARRHARCIQKQMSSIGNSRRRQRFLTTSVNYKAAKTIMILVGLFLVCWLSYIILVTANIMCDICHPREVTWLGNAINYSSIALNPVLYGLHNKQIRQVIIRQLVGCFKQRGHCQQRMATNGLATETTFSFIGLKHSDRW